MGHPVPDADQKRIEWIRNTGFNYIVGFAVDPVPFFPDPRPHQMRSWKNGPGSFEKTGSGSYLNMLFNFKNKCVQHFLNLLIFKIVYQIIIYPKLYFRQYYLHIEKNIINFTISVILLTKDPDADSDPQHCLCQLHSAFTAAGNITFYLV